MTGFLEFLLDEGVLKFGDFTLKSGRQSPYFFNLGEIASGAAFERLGDAYADALLASGLDFDVLFGPAYKGIPIAVATAQALARKGKDVGVAYNRKEAKDHGEGGSLVGAPVEGRVVLIDDVLTSGKAIREALALIDRDRATVAGVVIAMDRQERNDADRTAVQGLSAELGAPVISIATLTELIRYLEGAPDRVGSFADALRTYQQNYCQIDD